MTGSDQEALDYHSGPPKPGKLEIRATKPMSTQLDLSLAYSPGVAAPCRVIAEDADASYEYTNRGNLVGVVTNGTAVLGLGDIGPDAAKPVMEGKAVLFKRFADIDVFDLELRGDPETVIAVVRALEPTFGGINLEDIKAPDAFYIEEQLRESLKIPVFHDDQHGTAIIAGAAFLNAVEISGKRIEEVKLVVSGAGAAAIAVTRLLIELGLRPEHILMADRDGILRPDREMNDPYRAQFARETEARTLADALVGADAFLGLSVGGIVTGEMVAKMGERPIIFAMANPDPEISWPEATEARPDAIMATGRSDYPNQVNNVLGFPYIFRGALDVQATSINQQMKIAAVRALAALAREPVPPSVSRAYNDREFRFGPEYIIPTPFDPRALLWVAPAVARAAMSSGVARRPIEDWEAYRVRLEHMMDPGRGLLREIIQKARRDPKRIVLSEGTDPRVIKAAAVLQREGIAIPVLMGREDEVREAAREAGVDLADIEIVYPRTDPRFDGYARSYLELNQRGGATPARAREDVGHRSSFAMMMVREGDADGAVMGATRPYAEAVRPALQIIGTRRRACGLHMVLTRDRTLFFADTTMNIDPDVDALVDMTSEVVAHVRSFDIEPRVAMLSFANFGAVRHADTEKMARAAARIREREPELMIEGEIQVDVAVDMALRNHSFPWSRLTEAANTFIFPNLASANIAYKMLHQLGGASIFGPILLGMKRPVNILAFNSDASDIVNLAAYTVVRAQDAAARGDRDGA
ncbi:MAG: NADP-dependent malic enzyme [Deltaproteobacteria bacterium]|nr:NADP-dependent malic enzyme [Deltaproteobacteria bacterium]